LQLPRKISLSFNLKVCIGNGRQTQYMAVSARLAPDILHVNLRCEGCYQFQGLSGFAKRVQKLTKVDGHEGEGNEREGGEGLPEDQAADHGEEGGGESGDQGEGIAEAEKAGGRREQGEKYEVADTEGEARRLAERWEDEEQEVKRRGVFSDEGAGWTREH
jgi:hypothetical protein